MYLSVCARQPEPSVAAVEAALYDVRSLLRHHAMRRTLWVMTPHIVQLAHASCTRRIAAVERRRLVGLLDGGEDWLDRSMAEIVALVADDGPIGTREVGQRLPHTTRKLVAAPGTRNAVEVAAHTRVLLQAGFEGRLIRTRPHSSWVGSQYAWAAMDEWTATPIDALDAAEAAAGLARTWLGRFGPATPDDLQWWTGWTKTATRRALEAAGAETVRLDGGDGVALPGDTPGARDEQDPGPWVALLPGLDPTAMGWKRRDWYLDGTVAARVTDRSGNLGPTVWADGRIVGGWAQRPDGTIATEVVHRLSGEHLRLLDVETARLREAVGPVRFRVRFPSPNQRDLRA